MEHGKAGEKKKGERQPHLREYATVSKPQNVTGWSVKNLAAGSAERLSLGGEVGLQERQRIRA
eukprot:scaffold280155_cov18-Tisochrysis_lutea.AAC.2